MTREEFLKCTSDYTYKMADTISANITIRYYDNYGNSHDETRKAADEEKKILYKIAYSALLACRFSNLENEDGVLDMAEFLLHEFIPSANAYVSIYIPLKKAMGTW